MISDGARPRRPARLVREFGVDLSVIRPFVFLAAFVLARRIEFIGIISVSQAGIDRFLLQTGVIWSIHAHCRK